MDQKPEPTNYHELAIAEAIDGEAPNSVYESIVAEVVVSVPFDISIADTQFLFNYAHWRLGPLKKQPEAARKDLKRSA